MSEKNCTQDSADVFKKRKRGEHDADFLSLIEGVAEEVLRKNQNGLCPKQEIITGLEHRFSSSTSFDSGEMICYAFQMTAKTLLQSHEALVQLHEALI
jgi:hypothetical protein